MQATGIEAEGKHAIATADAGVLGSHHSARPAGLGVAALIDDDRCAASKT